MMKIVCVLFCVVITFQIIACEQQDKDENSSHQEVTEIVAVNSPLFYFSEKLASDFAKVIYPVKEKLDPKDWKPSIEDILKLQQSELIILNGPGYSTWVEKVSLPESKLINSHKQIETQLIKLSEQTTHSHGPKGQHSHSEVALTVWMDPELAKKQVLVIAEAFQKRWPEHEQTILKNKEQLLLELSELDNAYTKISHSLKTKKLIYSHPVYQYFEQRYQLNGISLHWEPDVMPSNEQWNKLKSITNENNNILFVWEDFPMLQIIEKMKSMKIDYVVLKPAAHMDKVNWYSEQLSNINRLNFFIIENE